MRILGIAGKTTNNFTQGLPDISQIPMDSSVSAFPQRLFYSKITCKNATLFLLTLWENLWVKIKCRLERQLTSLGYPKKLCVVMPAV